MQLTNPVPCKVQGEKVKHVIFLQSVYMFRKKRDPCTMQGTG